MLGILYDEIEEKRGECSKEKDFFPQKEKNIAKKSHLKMYNVGTPVAIKYTQKKKQIQRELIQLN